MKRSRILAAGMLIATLALLVPPSALAQTEQDPYKWYGIGGELNGSNRWLARIGITKHVGAEVLFGLAWESDADSDYTLGAGVVYDYAPTSDITPFTMCRVLARRWDNGESKTSLGFEVGGGVEYVIKKRIGLSAELNFNFSFDPSRIMTTTLLRAYFYL
jgi:opacity protein-like surface antigen